MLKTLITMVRGRTALIVEELGDQNALLILDQQMRDAAGALDREGRRILARTVFSAVHGIVALGLEEKLVSLSLSDLARQLTAMVRAIAAGREQLRAIDSVAGPADLRRD